MVDNLTQDSDGAYSTLKLSLVTCGNTSRNNITTTNGQLLQSRIYVKSKIHERQCCCSFFLHRCFAYRTQPRRSQSAVFGDVSRHLLIRTAATDRPMDQSWTWVHFPNARSNPTQATNSLTQSNPIHDGCPCSDPHPIQSIDPSAAAKTISLLYRNRSFGLV